MLKGVKYALALKIINFLEGVSNSAENSVALTCKCCSLTSSMQTHIGTVLVQASHGIDFSQLKAILFI